MKKKVTYIISNINKALAFEWIVESLDRDRFALSFILLNPATSVLEAYLAEHKIPVYRVDYKGKKSMASAILKTARILRKEKTDIVHAHLFDAGLVGLSAARLAGIKKRIYTRHHSDYHHSYHPHAVKYDKLINSMATDVIAISEMVKRILTEKENLPADKVHLIHHGFRLEKFAEVEQKLIKEVASKYNPRNRRPVIGVISRYTEWKGIQFIIPAFELLLKDYPDALLVLCNSKGNYADVIKNRLAVIPENNRCEIAFEDNVFAVYRLFDIFVHVPIDEEVEAFGQTYVEALASGIPSVFTLSGVAPEFIRDKKNAVVVPFKDPGEIHRSMKWLLENKKEAEALVQEGRENVMQLFPLSFMIEKLENLYES